MTDAMLARESAQPPRLTASRSGPFVVDALLGNLALLSAIVVMPVVIAVGYLLGSHG